MSLGHVPVERLYRKYLADHSRQRKCNRTCVTVTNLSHQRSGLRQCWQLLLPGASDDLHLKQCKAKPMPDSGRISWNFMEFQGPKARLASLRPIGVSAPAQFQSLKD